MRPVIYLVLGLLLAGGTLDVTWAGTLSGVIKNAQGKLLRDVAIWVVSPATPATSGRHALMDQRQHMFTPHVLVVSKGTTVDFPNSEDMYHNVFSYYSGKRFDLGLYPPGTSKSIKFDKVGVHELFCNIHSSMHAYIIVVESMHYDTTSKAGTFAIRDLQPGAYTLKFWHAKKQQVYKVIIPPGGDKQIEAVFK